MAKSEDMGKTLFIMQNMNNSELSRVETQFGNNDAGQIWLNKL